MLVRVIRVPRSPQHGSKDFETLVSRIVSATNWQNAIRPSDLMSNDRRQIEIERQLRKLHYLYLRKRMTKGEARRAAGTRHLRVINKEEIAQAVAACDLDPSIVRAGREQLFEERLYGQVFPNEVPNDYLTRYWLLREVSYAARGSRERVYAKWLVVHFAWQSLAPLCRRRSHATAFREACERDTAAVVTPLLRALDLVFSVAHRFYRASRGSGPTAIDVATFFKRRKLDEEFTRFWRGSRNPARGRFTRDWARFQEALDEEVTG